MYFYVSTVPREKRYGKYKKVLYLEEPTNAAVTVRRRTTTIIPSPHPPPPPRAPSAPIPMMLEPTPSPTIIDAAPRHHSPAVLHYPPAAPAPAHSPIDVIAVDPSRRGLSSSLSSSSRGSSRASSSSSSSSSSRSRSSRVHVRSRDREVLIERERIVPMPVPVPVQVPVQPEYDTFRYIEAPRRYEPRANRHHTHDSPEVIIEDHHHRRHIRDW